MDKYCHSHKCRNFFTSYCYNDDVKGDPPTCEEVLLCVKGNCNRNFFTSYCYNDDVKGDSPTCEEVLSCVKGKCNLNLNSSIQLFFALSCQAKTHRRDVILHAG